MCSREHCLALIHQLNHCLKPSCTATRMLIHPAAAEATEAVQLLTKFLGNWMKSGCVVERELCLDRLMFLQRLYHCMIDFRLMEPTCFKYVLIRGTVYRCDYESLRGALLFNLLTMQYFVWFGNASARIVQKGPASLAVKSRHRENVVGDGTPSIPLQCSSPCKNRFFFVWKKHIFVGHQFKLFKHHTNHCTRSSFFCEHIINVWNSLPSIVNFSSLNYFKQSIGSVDFSVFLKCS